ncbi:MAG: aspartate-semialdehyde dehydrogenase, partial [Chloroflexi bacterium]|nr:aspartate-semialdehyde dehydrogenase [Chloroflexota bacterium]
MLELSKHDSSGWGTEVQMAAETTLNRLVNVAVVGATGLVGREFLRILEERSFPVGEIRALASERSAGKTVPFRGGDLTVQAVTRDAFKGMDFALIAVGDEVSREWAPIAAQAGCVVVDKSNAWRMDPSVPLVVPEVNPGDTRAHQGIIAGPNCSTIQMVVALAPLHRVNPITRVIVDSYQSASGTGGDAVEELWEETRALAAGKELRPSVYPYPLAMNLFPHIGGFSANGYCSEEIKLI